MRNGERSELLGDIYGGVTAARCRAAVGTGLWCGLRCRSHCGSIRCYSGRLLCLRVRRHTKPGLRSDWPDDRRHGEQLSPNSPTTFPRRSPSSRIGGLLQIAFGLMRVGRYVSYTPYSVVSGFMSGCWHHHHPDSDVAVCWRRTRQRRAHGICPSLAGSGAKHQHRCALNRTSRTGINDLLAHQVRPLPACALGRVDRGHTRGPFRLHQRPHDRDSPHRPPRVAHPDNRLRRPASDRRAGFDPRTAGVH